MKRSFGRLLHASLAALVLASFAMAPYADAAAGGGGRGGGGGGGRAAAGGGGGGARAAGAGGGAHAAAGGGARQNAQVNNSRADVRTNDVRSGSVNNVNVERNVNVNVDQHGCCGGWDNDYHPIATAAAVGTAVAVTSAVIGSMVRTVPAGCVPMNYGGIVYQQCGGTWYQPQGSQFVVVNPPY
jgi:hypothetical protein